LKIEQMVAEKCEDMSAKGLGMSKFQLLQKAGHAVSNTNEN